MECSCERQGGAGAWEKASLMIRGPQRTMSPSAGILQDLRAGREVTPTLAPQQAESKALAAKQKAGETQVPAAGARLLSPRKWRGEETPPTTFSVCCRCVGVRVCSGALVEAVVQTRAHMYECRWTEPCVNFLRSCPPCSSFGLGQGLSMGLGTCRVG